MTVSARIRHGGTAVALAALLMLSGGAVPPAFAEEAASPVVARVNGEPITEADLAAAAQDFREQLARIPPQSWRQQLIDLLVEIRLTARAAEDLALDKDPAAAQRLRNAHDRALRLEFLRARIVTPVTEEAIRKRFDEKLAAFVPGDQYQASHILVQSEDEAKAIIADLDKGGDFAAIAKEKSLDPGSKDDGGDLGFFSPASMVKPFADAVVALAVGTYTKEPVQSQFGWHVIKSVGTRKEPPPTFEQQAGEIRDAMVEELFTAAMDDLRAKATIEMVEPEKPAEPTKPEGGAADKPAN